MSNMLTILLFDMPVPPFAFALLFTPDSQAYIPLKHKYVSAGTEGD
jgi:hypothetical protein